MSSRHPIEYTEATAVRVLVPSLLWSYTEAAKEVEFALPPAANGAALLGDVLTELDRRFPGLRFRIVDEQGRIRAHIKIFVDGALARQLSQPLPAKVEVMIVGALSGG